MYDPLINDFPANQPLPNSYWHSQIDLGPPTKTLTGTQTTNVAIIGGGYTGLLTAFYLATEFNIDCHVLEANQVGFGASGRNAGFVLKGSGRLGFAQMAKRWDIITAKGIYDEFTQAVLRVDELIATNNIECQRQEKGYLKVAHNVKAMQQLEGAAKFIQQHCGDNAEVVSKSELVTNYMNNKQACGALRLTDGFGVQPLKLLLGYKQMMQAAGVLLSEQSCVYECLEEAGKYRLQTDKGELIANKVIFAGNGYSPKQITPQIDKKFLPILSNIIVTEPLTAAQLLATGIQTRQVTMDTRILKYYYRLLPDNRLLFGGRGAVWGKNQADQKFSKRLKMALDNCFPALEKVRVDYNWTGWIAASFDDMPHVYEKNGLGYSLGYCGAGLSFSAQAAYRLAQSIAGEALPELPLYQQPLPAMPFAKARRWGQWAYYHYGYIKDKFG
ncbi:MAG: NAD(P)/FAD-dependent oxidoreductase [Parashewanella sp.]